MHAEPPGRVAHVPAHALEHAQNVLALELFQGLAQRRARVLAQARPRLGHRHVERHVLEVDEGLRARTTARCRTFSSSRTFPGQS